MSVLIRGMEMPKSCSECPLMESDEEIGCHCYLTKQYAPRARPNNCPLIEAPPHGRLIESVELYGKAEEIKTKALSAYDKPQSWQFGAFWAIEQIEAALTNAPTIIEAEEGNHD